MTMSSNLLLPEILSRIFSLLHIEDRKTVRLVCRKWNDCCNCPQILKREKFVFRAGCKLENIDLFLRNCENIRFSVEFRGLDLDKLSDDLWQILGENMYSLKLFQCKGTTEVTKNIFLHCLNMHSFESFGLGIASYSSALWDELIQLDIEHQKMIVFHLFLPDGEEELPKDVLRKIFKIFPSISNFGTGYPPYSRHYTHRFGQGSLLNTFDPASIQELTINVPCSGLWIQEFSNVPELKLQKLETILKNPTVSLDIFTQFLQNQRALKTLKITLMTQTTKTDYTEAVLSKILSICTELIDFRFKSDIILRIDEFCRAIRTVSESKLECFMLSIRYAYNFEYDTMFRDNLSTYLLQSTNKRLRTLKLRVGKGLPEEYCLPILQHFYDLRYLEIAAVSDGVLQTIFKYHINLQTLVLRKIEHCTVFGFTGEECDTSVAHETSYSISRLQKLEYLKVKGDLNELWVEKIIRHFKFPRLKYLCLTCEFDEEISLQVLPAIIPLVEVLIIDYMPVHVDEYSFLCQHMQRLKLLSCFMPQKRKILENLFVVRPSLKYVVDSHVYCYYERFSKTLNMVPLSFQPLKKTVLRDLLPLW